MPRGSNDRAAMPKWRSAAEEPPAGAFGAAGAAVENSEIATSAFGLLAMTTSAGGTARREMMRAGTFRRAPTRGERVAPQ